MSAALYLATSLGLLWGAHRTISPIRRWVALVLILLPLCFTGRALLIDGLYGPFDLPYQVAPLVYQRGEHGFGDGHNNMLSDLYTQIIPYRKAVHDALARGEWPLWNPYTLSGEPLAAEAQPAVYSPFTLLALLLPVAKSFTYSATLWFFIAAFGTYLFAREIGCGEIASMFAGAAFMASSGLVFFILWPLGESWTLLPFVFVAVRRLHLSPWPLFVALTLLMLTGHPESVLHIVFLGAGYAIFLLLRGQPRRAVVHAIVAGVLTLGVCAIDLLPFREASLQTSEYTNRVRFYAGSHRTASAQESLTILATDFLADLQQRAWPPFSACVGSIALALFLYALWRVRGGETWFLMGMLVFCMLEQARTPLELVVQRLPLFGIAVNDRFAFGAAFAFAVLAALGLEQLNRERDVVRFALCAIFTIAGVLVALRLASRSPFVSPNQERWGEYRLFADIAMLSIAALIAIARPRIALPAIFVCLLLQRTMQESRVYPTFDADVAYPPIPLLEPLKNVHEPYRLVGQGITFLPGTNAFYGLEDARGYTAMTLRRCAVMFDLWSRPQPVFVNWVEDLQRPLLSVLNVRYAIALKEVTVPPRWREIARYRGSKLLENLDVLPRAYVPRFVHVASVAPLIEMSLAEDLLSHAWIEAEGAASVRENGPGQVRIRRRKSGFAIDADMQRPGWVVVSESAWTGWRAYIDGRRVRHQFADVALLGIYVPAGKHAIRLVYWPDSFVTGRAISATTLLGIAVYFIARRRAASRGKVLQSGRSRRRRTPALRTDAA